VKKTSLLALLIPLALFEIYLCTAFLPDLWQRAIYDHVPNIFPRSNDWTPITHPLLSQEIEQVLHEHIGIRIFLYAITVGLLTGNALLIRLLWRLRASHKVHPTVGKRGSPVTSARY
jgi:hypothetical protein